MANDSDPVPVEELEQLATEWKFDSKAHTKRARENGSKCDYLAARVFRDCKRELEEKIEEFSE